jgi:hypothetical protein
LVVFSLCDGAPSGAPTYYDPLTGTPATPVQPLRDCASGVNDFEQIVFCDSGTNPATPFSSRVTMAIWSLTPRALLRLMV